MSPKQETAEGVAAMPETCRSRNSVMRENQRRTYLLGSGTS